MIGLAVALGLAAAPGTTDLAIRMRESAAAAQALQGGLDGTWTLLDAHHRLLFVFQITDPAAGAGPLEGAWRRPVESAPAGLIDAIARRDDRLTIRFSAGGNVVRVHLHRRAEGAWSGEASENGHDLPVALRRTASAPTPR
jgi:hypothetical protein